MVRNRRRGNLQRREETAWVDWPAAIEVVPLKQALSQWEFTLFWASAPSGRKAAASYCLNLPARAAGLKRLLSTRALDLVLRGR
jgi:hypothetical protein